MWYCRICNQWADGGHVQGSRHQKRAAWFDWYPEEFDSFLADTADDHETNAERRAAISRPDLDPWGDEWEPKPNHSSNWYEAWSEQYKRPYYYNTVTMAQSWDIPEEGLATDARTRDTKGPVSTAQRKSSENVPAPWQKEWSEEHRQYFYWNRKTNESRWELPDWADEWC
jgi:hypothetical protein